MVRSSLEMGGRRELDILLLLSFAAEAGVHVRREARIRWLKPTGDNHAYPARVARRNPQSAKQRVRRVHPQYRTRRLSKYSGESWGADCRARYRSGTDRSRYAEPVVILGRDSCFRGGAARPGALLPARRAISLDPA